MAESIKKYQQKFDALTVRERGLIVASLLVLFGYLWWYLWAEAVITETGGLRNKAMLMARDADSLSTTADMIELRLKQGLNKDKEQLRLLRQQELEQISLLLRQKSVELIPPDDMFRLLQQMLFKDSKVKLTGLKRKQVSQAFSTELDDSGNDANTNKLVVYRHDMLISFQGRFEDVLKYIKSLEGLDWKLIWNRIAINTDKYPLLNVEMELSTLSDSQYWVGL